MKIIVAGQDLYAELQAEKARLVPLRGESYDSDVLCRLQRNQSARGILGAQIVESMYGFSVRYDSGLQNWGILRGSRGRPASETTREAAVAFCIEWVARDPERRYAWE
jgi:hypothetical protein